MISSLVDPRIEWAVGREFTVREFDLASAQELCENALLILQHTERGSEEGPGYRIVRAALDRYDPLIPGRFDSRMDDENQLLYLSGEDRDGQIRTEWIFHWDEKVEAWILAAVQKTERNEPEADGISPVTESRTEV